LLVEAFGRSHVRRSWVEDRVMAEDPMRIARDFENAYAAAFNRRDVGALAALFVSDATIVTEWGDVVEGRAAFARGLAEAFARVPASLTLENEPTHARLVADGVIVSHGKSNRSDTTTWTADHLTFTRVLVREADAWRLAANHVSEPIRRGDPRETHT
jgi:uncharacterized protein (TIGR02246 family)